MAEEKTQGIQNKWLLLIAALLAGIVVFIYNAHIRAIRAEQQGQTIDVIQLRQDLQPGERVTARDIERVSIPQGSESAFGKVMKWKDRDFVTASGGREVNQPVFKGQYLLWEHVMGGGSSNPSAKIAPGKVAMPVEFDSDYSPGDILSVGDSVNLLGQFAEPGGGVTYYRILEGVRVLNVGGRGAAAEPGKARTSRSSYDKITIELDRGVSIELMNLLTHMTGSLKVELNRAGDLPARNAGQINPALRSLAARAKSLTEQSQPMPASPGSN
jgi:Flp pilus assembly protein CpaB